MGQDHISRLAAPKSWPIERKINKWISRPVPGPHSLEGSIPLSVLIRDVLKYAKTAKEIKLILNQGKVLIDKKIRKEEKFPVGFMDVIEIPTLSENYRMLYNKSGVFSVMPISKEETNIKILKIINKCLVKKGMIQITLHDGRNILVNKFEGKVGDSILFDLEKKKIIKVLSLDKGASIYLSGGAHIGQIGKIKQVFKSRDLQRPRILVEVENKEYLTPVDCSFVVGQGKPEIALEAKK